ncbi:sensor histidine kinase [Thermophagus xiamenensis]|uniref:Histidine kinase n=1 Tax=Thermophagus xiamenensis TaxID=385682 RepID=A0A1I2DKL4_9BACT|nr:histidine kinase [Thermophagus xiamenensis]SFE80997.1 Histidine kinase [Thermophagus xiamenensis]
MVHLPQLKDRNICCDINQFPRKIAFYKRLIAEILVSLLFVSLIVALNNHETIKEMSKMGVLFSIIMFVLLSEGIFVFDTLVAKKYPWHYSPAKRVFILLSFAFVWLLVVGVFGNFVRPFFIPDEVIVDNDSFSLGITILVLFMAIYVSALISANYHKSLHFFVMENEKLRREKLRMDYFALQDQLNPHFLFNNLSTLMAIIPEDQDKALRFTENFTDVYRYVLRSSRVKLISLEEELSFIKAYLDLHQERLGKGLSYSVDIEAGKDSKMLPPLSLQYLVENAIKHNVATSEQPLSIIISVKDEKVEVSNNLNLKASTYSTNTGLENLKKRYQYLNLGDNVEIFNTGNRFVVTVPLIDKKNVYELQDFDR